MRQGSGRTREESLEYMRGYAVGYRDQKKIRKNYLSNIPERVFVINTVEKTEPINEEFLEIEERYCSVFACGRKLTLQESLFGNKCINHQ